MSVSDYKELKEHIGHDVFVAAYGDDDNVSIECQTCNEILVSYDKASTSFVPSITIVMTSGKIYTFEGAEAEALINHMKRFPDAKTYSITDKFRYTYTFRSSKIETVIERI